MTREETDADLEKAIDLLQVAMLDLEQLKPLKGADRFKTRRTIDKISQQMINCADLIRASAPAYPLPGSERDLLPRQL